jgi:hypothetical protein
MSPDGMHPNSARCQPQPPAGLALPLSPGERQGEGTSGMSTGRKRRLGPTKRSEGGPVPAPIAQPCPPWPRRRWIPDASAVAPAEEEPFEGLILQPPVLRLVNEELAAGGRWGPGVLAHGFSLRLRAGRRPGMGSRGDAEDAEDAEREGRNGIRRFIPLPPRPTGSPSPRRRRNPSRAASRPCGTMDSVRLMARRVAGGLASSFHCNDCCPRVQ